ncbi:hypothetical protein LCGC14_0610770 [marine sediment metagenome]|uniref:Uncharacterized protein n=1 Tax=marine sediment metagenome TaxID=412755 RepID=A0A0F9RS02_9ZZZZ|nr:hypothetical protein [bacterium]
MRFIKKNRCTQEDSYYTHVMIIVISILTLVVLLSVIFGVVTTDPNSYVFGMILSTIISILVTAIFWVHKKKTIFLKERILGKI